RVAACVLAVAAIVENILAKLREDGDDLDARGVAEGMPEEIRNLLEQFFDKVEVVFPCRDRADRNEVGIVANRQGPVEGYRRHISPELCRLDKTTFGDPLHALWGVGICGKQQVDTALEGC